MTDMSAALAEIEKEKRRPQPTPPVGMPIVWYLNGDRRLPRAAVVTDIEGPGRIAVAITPKNSQTLHRTGVHYTHHPDCEDEDDQPKNTPQVARNGTWDYVPGYFSTIPREHFQPHLDLIEKREVSLLKQMEAEEAALKAAKDRKAKNQQPATV